MSQTRVNSTFGEQVTGLIRTMRIKQWVKNGFLFVPLLFDGKLDEPQLLLTTAAGFMLFNLMTSAVYIINDIADLEADRRHPRKRLRPLPSGQLSREVAIAAAVLLLVVALPLAFLVKPMFAVAAASYLLIQLLYSFWLKHIVLIDVMTIAAGFLIRVAAGAILIVAERFSPWLYVFTAMLALFLGFSKRRQELVELDGGENHQRAILDHYSLNLLDQIILIVTATTTLTYALYTFSAEGLPENHTMMLTTPFVLYGIFRYLYLIHVRGEGSAPDEVVLEDRPIQIAIVLWALSVVLVLYVLPS